jgi:hypothetical protein
LPKYLHAKYNKKKRMHYASHALNASAALHHG